MMAKVHMPKDEEPIARGDGDPTYVYMRAEDRSFGFKAAYWRDRYWFLWAPALAIITAAGFGFRTPAQTTKELQGQIDTLKTAMVRSDTARDRLERKVDIQLRLDCVSKATTDEQKLLAGLDCRTMQAVRLP